MIKNQIISNKGVPIGNNSRTLLNLLLGFNSSNEIVNENHKIRTIFENKVAIDIITDLSLYKEKKGSRLWENVLRNTTFMAGTVPVYTAINEKMVINIELLYESICEQCEAGVSIITIHPTANINLIEMSKKRLIHCTSRGGRIVINDLLKMRRNENAYIMIIDKIIDICKKNNTIISIGSIFRSATIIDAMDETYMKELGLQLELASYIEKRGGLTIVETPGHADPKSIDKICDILIKYPYPIMPLGPIPTDIACGQDDTAATIGAVLMGVKDCADILSIVTSQEHLGGIPDINVISEAILKYEIAKHIIDINKLNDMNSDYIISKKRSIFNNCNANNETVCMRCGNFCPLRNDV